MMRITQKMSLALGVAFIVLCALLWMRLQLAVAPQFARLELDRAQANFDRAQNAIDRELSQLDAYRVDYGVWDDAYAYRTGRNPDFVVRNMPPSMLADLNLDIYMFFDAAGAVVAGLAYDDSKDVEISVEELAPVSARSWAGFAEGLTSDPISKSIIETRAGFMLVSYGAVANTDGTGDYVGHLLVGRLLSERYQNVLSDYTRVDLAIAPPAPDTANAPEVKWVDGAIVIAAPLSGADGAPAAMLITSTPSAIVAVGEQTIKTAFLLLTIMLLIFIGLVSLLLRAVAVRPIERLTRLMSAADAEAPEHDLGLARRSDEIGVLYSSFSGLIGRIDDRSRELETALTAAEAGERAKSQFLANMSHEIRTPMNGVMGMADLLAGTSLSETQRTFVDVIVKSSDALLTIINDVLDFSKLDAGMTALHPAPFRLHDIVDDAAALIAPRSAARKVEVAVRVDPALPDMFIGDAGRLRQILVNLASNAAKFTDRGHILIDVSAASESADKRLALTFTVEDTGVGIPDNKLALIFEKFNQADSSSTRAHEGTGLGLAIARSLVELMGGTITVESEVGVGSRFAFTIALPASASEQEKRAPVASIVGARMLIVDDNEITRRILAELAASWGFACVSCASGAAALVAMRGAAQKGERFHMVVMDHHMPGMSGADAVRAIRREPDFRATPIVLLTSVDDGDAGSAQDGGVQGQVTKPIRAGALLRAIHASAAIAPAVAPAPAPAAREAGECGRVDVLVAEDNEVNRLVVGYILANAGLSYEMAENGREAVDKFAARRPRIVLMDISMPELNGIEATAQIRAMEKKSGARTPNIGVTAHAVKGDREQCLEAGMDDYVSKPVSPQKLADKIRQHLAQSAANAA